MCTLGGGYGGSILGNMSILLGSATSQKHKVFVSYHHVYPDQDYRNKFENLFATVYDIIVSKSVQLGDIDPNLKSETIRQKIRDEYLRDSTVTVVLVGSETWQRKHVDWEIGSSIRHTDKNPRSGLMGILLPSYYRNKSFLSSNQNSKYTIPPRLSDNLDCGFAEIYNWSEDPSVVKAWIQRAFDRRFKIQPDNSRESFKSNHSGDKWS
jgi:hypothetical protein